MNAEPAGSTVLPHLAGAANDEVMPLQIDVTIESSTQPSGWTAFEVWRSRIKEVYDARVTLAPGPQADGTRNVGETGG
jgi:hypothetical protein